MPPSIDTSIVLYLHLCLYCYYSDPQMGRTCLTRREQFPSIDLRIHIVVVVVVVVVPYCSYDLLLRLNPNRFWQLLGNVSLVTGAGSSSILFLTVLPLAD